MKVHELIEKLKECDPDLEVRVRRDPTLKRRPSRALGDLVEEVGTTNLCSHFEDWQLSGKTVVLYWI